MIRPQISADYTTVRLPLADRTTSLLDDLAVAYAEDPAEFGLLLVAHAAAVLCLDHAVVDDSAHDVDRAMRAAEADGTREALLGELPIDHQLDPLLGPDDAITLAGHLTSLAGRIRHGRPSIIGKEYHS
ncbi:MULTISPECIES: hypothetical protein [unclassified Streptomyces]|uniref:hypothetical protein n=1 Tax=unclassified Streptomyces TaxID=2593676 RepID=UPI0035DCAA51